MLLVKYLTILFRMDSLTHLEKLRPRASFGYWINQISFLHLNIFRKPV